MPVVQTHHQHQRPSYASFLKNVAYFRELNSLREPLHFGSDITVDDLIENRALILSFTVQFKLSGKSKKEG